jgi:hypothetical protein
MQLRQALGRAALLLNATVTSYEQLCASLVPLMADKYKYAAAQVNTLNHTMLEHQRWVRPTVTESTHTHRHTPERKTTLIRQTTLDAMPVTRTLRSMSTAFARRLHTSDNDTGSHSDIVKKPSMAIGIGGIAGEVHETLISRHVPPDAQLVQVWVACGQPVLEMCRFSPQHPPTLRSPAYSWLSYALNSQLFLVSCTAAVCPLVLSLLLLVQPLTNVSSWRARLVLPWLTR